MELSEDAKLILDVLEIQAKHNYSYTLNQVNSELSTLTCKITGKTITISSKLYWEIHNKTN